MLSGDYLILICLCGFFLVFGMVLMIWGCGRKGYSASAPVGSDAKRYFERQTTKSVPMIIGGLIALVCGLALLAIGIIFRTLS